MRKFKNWVAQALYYVVFFCAKMSPCKKGNSHILLIKTDEIGDYVLFRAYLKYFKASPRYNDHKITLVGNQAWRAIFEAYDKSTVDEVIWLDKTQYKKNLIYRYNFLKQIRTRIQVSEVINCIYSRSFDLDDAIAWLACANNKIAMHGDGTNRISDNQNYDKYIYNTIIDAGDVTIFDVERNRNFVEKVLGIERIELSTLITVKNPNRPDFPYYILFLGAGNPERKWPVSSFVKLANHIYENYGLTPIVCGGPGDHIEGEQFILKYAKKALNYAGKTTILQLIELLSEARLLVCVDTGALHIAAAVGCPVVGLYSGKFFGRFAPYPTQISTQFYAVYPDFTDALIAQKNPILYNTSVMKNNTINLIPAEKLFPYVDKLLQ